MRIKQQVIDFALGYKLELKWLSPTAEDFAHFGNKTERNQARDKLKASNMLPSFHHAQA